MTKRDILYDELRWVRLSLEEVTTREAGFFLDNRAKCIRAKITDLEAEEQKDERRAA